MRDALSIQRTTGREHEMNEQMLTNAQAASALGCQLFLIPILIERGVIVGAELMEPAWRKNYRIPVSALREPKAVAFAEKNGARLNAKLDQIERAREIENAPQ